MKFMLIVLLIIVAIVAIVYAVRAYSDARKNQDKRDKPTPRDPFATDQETTGDPLTIKAGDMLQFGDDKYFVRGTLRIREGAYQWAEHFFQADAGATRQWLSVEEDPDVQMAIWRDRRDVKLEPTAGRLSVDGMDFSLDERGQAQYTSEGTTGLPASGSVDYADYNAPDGTMLSFERFNGGAWEVSMGRPVPVGTFTIYPGS